MPGVNATTGPQLPKYISHAFGSLDQPWKPGYLRSAYSSVAWKSSTLCSRKPLTTNI
jgi:hypothetical protein